MRNWFSGFKRAAISWWLRGSYVSILTHAMMLIFGVLLGAYFFAWFNNHEIGKKILEFAPVISVILGLIVFLWQVIRARYSQRIDLILKLSERFEKMEMRVIRAKASTALLRSYETEDDSVSQVLDFFEETGFLLERKAIDGEAVYEFFYHWATSYHQATITYRKKINEDANIHDLYCKMDSLFKTLTGIAGENPTLSDEKIKEFLREESNLISKVKAKYSFSNKAGLRKSNAGRLR